MPNDVNEQAALDLDGFVARDYGRVVAAVGMITGNRQDAPDAVQDALVGLLARPPRLPIDNLPAWVTVVASNRARDRHRTRLAEARAFERLGAPDGAVEDRPEMLDTDLQRALDALPLQQRRVCALHYLADQSVEAIAQILGISPGSVKTHLHRARKALATSLKVEELG